MLRYISTILYILMLLLFGAISAQAQGLSPNSESHILHFSEDFSSTWLLREGRVEHPAVAGLSKVEANKLYFYVDPNYELRAQSVIQSSASAREMTMRYLPESFVSDVHIYLLGDINQYFEGLGEKARAPSWAAGLAILSDGVILIRLKPTTASLIEPERTLAHELNHIALKRMSNNNPLPHWFYEGFAMLSTEKWNIHRAEILAHASMTGRIFAFDKISNSFPAQGAAVDLAYAQSSHFVSWIVKQWGEANFKRFLERIAAGTAFKDAFRSQYGVALASAEMEWRSGLEKKNSWFAPLLTITSILMFLGAVIVLGLGIMRQKRRKRALKQPDALPREALPKNLRHFGPFT
ncbi:MAG: peptidase MA family metallohydrolase [Bradymonadales bacterium]|jgi:hypothetical protein